MTNSNEILKTAFEGKYAIPQLNINNLEWAKYILEECNELKSPVILGVSEGAAKYMGGYNVVFNLVKGLILDLNISIPVILHLDHGSSVESCKKAIDAGFTSVMIDASKRELEENIRITKEIVDYASLKNVSVEAEIGHIGGTEDNISNEIYYAKTDECIRLYNETKIDSLAPGLGSAHGFYKGEPKLNFERMKEISKRLNIPLVLHGGTGIPDELIKEAIRSGIAKVNINTELQFVWSKDVRIFLNNNLDVYDPRKIISSGENAIKEAVRHKIILLNSNNRI